MSLEFLEFILTSSKVLILSNDLIEKNEITIDILANERINNVTFVHPKIIYSNLFLGDVIIMEVNRNQQIAGDTTFKIPILYSQLNGLMDDIKNERNVFLLPLF
jgi:hypothetical protein